MVCCFRTQLLFILPRNAHEVVSQLPTPTPNQRSTTQNRYDYDIVVKECKNSCIFPETRLRRLKV